MPDYEKLLQLPFEVIWPLGAGYLAYRLAYVGRDAPHKTFDGTFLVFVFGAIAKGIASLIAVTAPEAPVAITAAMGAAFALVVAAIWRIWAAECVYDYLRERKVLDHDGQPDVWRSMLARQLPGPVQLIVTTKAGKIYLCDELGRYNDAPLGPCLLGEDGSIAMYVTAWRRVGEAKWHDVKPYREDVGFEMSFFKASEIERIDITRLA